MNASARQVHASLISREQQLEELVRLNAEFTRDLAQAQQEGPFIVRQHRNSPVKSSAGALCAHVDAWAAGTEQYDDMTVAGLRVRG
jgi:hypothetical protein